jgi:hypothetical protein
VNAAKVGPPKKKALDNAGSLRRRKRLTDTRDNAGIKHHRVGAPLIAKQFHLALVVHYLLPKNSWKTVSRAWGESQPSIIKLVKRYRAEASKFIAEFGTDSKGKLDRKGLESNCMVLAKTWRELREEKKPG